MPDGYVFLEVMGGSDPMKSDSLVRVPKSWLQRSSGFRTPRVIVVSTALSVPARPPERTEINLYHFAFTSSATASTEINWG
jgi:hypothetical protein